MVFAVAVDVPSSAAAWVSVSLCMGDRPRTAGTAQHNHGPNSLGWAGLAFKAAIDTASSSWGNCCQQTDIKVVHCLAFASPYPGLALAGRSHPQLPNLETAVMRIISISLQ